MKSYNADSENHFGADESLDLLNLISEALDASEDGLAIWRAIRDEDGSIKDFRLLLMNATGLSGLPKGMQEPIGKSIEEVTGEHVSKRPPSCFGFDSCPVSVTCVCARVSEITLGRAHWLKLVSEDPA